MNISLYLAEDHESEELFTTLLIEHFNIPEQDAQSLWESDIQFHFKRFKPGIFFVAEAPYVDKVYRNSYYRYFSSKLRPHKRDCARISLFSSEVTFEDFRGNDDNDALQKKFLGFIILRPTYPHVIGRSIISPKALNVNNFRCCVAKYSITVNSKKLEIEGFPHSSQDTETLSCAETTLWSCMDYFGTRYSEYKIVLPSRIIKTLNHVSYQRQLPTAGLNGNQISYALREYGFGSIVYAREDYLDNFEYLFSCYIESGIPLIVAMDNYSSGGNIGHALVCIGHKQISEESYARLQPHIEEDELLKEILEEKKIVIYDFDEINKEYVFSDDNHPVYSIATLAQPANNYPPDWQTCKVNQFIVPLYHKIFLEAYLAKKFVLNFLISGYHPILPKTELFIKLYLSSTRTFKDKLASCNDFNEDVKEYILSAPTPRFVWICLLSTKKLASDGLANGIIILDATDPNYLTSKPIIVAAYQGSVIYFDDESGKLKKDLLDLPNFCTFKSNLQDYQ